ncbi:hypothetical protein HYT51_01100 [Candidatus Woesearchaeota archaeon]|nr:hypothetical protein [Candidatus Woesearchaeota archaeon]
MKTRKNVGWRTFSKILGILFILFFAFSFYPSQDLVLVQPVDISVKDKTILFSWESRFNEFAFMVDDVIDFTSPLINKKVEGKRYFLSEPLNATTYYWKVIAYDRGKEVESRIASFQYRSEVSVASWIDGENYTLENTGNVPISVGIEEENDNLLITGAVVLDIGKTLEREIKNKTLYRAEQL